MSFDLKKLLDASVAQINPWDNGQNFNSVMAQKKPAVASTAQAVKPQARPVASTSFRMPNFQPLANQVNQYKIPGLGNYTVGNLGQTIDNVAIKPMVQSVNDAGNVTGAIGQAAIGAALDRTAQQKALTKQASLNQFAQTALGHTFNVHPDQNQQLHVDDVNAHNARQALGTIANDTINLAGVIPIGEGATLGTQVAKAGFKAGAKQLGKQALISGAKNAGVGAASGAAQALTEQDLTYQNALRDIGMGALVGGGIGAAAPVVGAGGALAVKGGKIAAREANGVVVRNAPAIADATVHLAQNPSLTAMGAMQPHSLGVLPTAEYVAGSNAKGMIKASKDGIAYPSVDGSMKYKVSNNNAKLNMDAFDGLKNGEPTTIKTILPHKEFNKDYKNFDPQVIAEQLPSDQTAVTRKAPNGTVTIHVDPNKFSSQEQLRNVLLEERNHAIQYREGHATGTVETRPLQAIMQNASPELKSLDGKYREVKALVGGRDLAQGELRKQLNQNDPKFADKLKAIHKQFDTQDDREMRQHLEQLRAQRLDLLQREANNPAAIKEMDKYANSFGEAEAKNDAASNLSQKELNKIAKSGDFDIYENVNPDVAVIDRGGNVSANEGSKPKPVEKPKTLPVGEQIGRLKAAIAKEPDPNVKMELASQLDALKKEYKPTPKVPQAIDSNGNQLALPAPKTREQKAALKVETKQQKAAIKEQATTDKVAAKGPVSPAEAKHIFKSTGIAPEVLQKNKIKQTPMVATEEGIAAKTPATANRAALKEQAHKLDIYNLGGKDRHPWSLSRETPDRIQEDVFGPNADKVKAFLNDKVRKNETNRLGFVNDAATKFEEIYKKAGITRGSKGDKLGFQYGEGKISKEDVLKAAPKSGQAIIEAADLQRQFYDQTLDSINKSLRHYGYPEIPKRKNYLTHTQEIGNVFERLGNLLSNDKSKLPTSMSGINMDTKPGKSWFKFAQQRTGDKSEQSLVRSFEAYLPGASNQIYHTDSVQRARALQNALTDPKLRVEAKTPVGTLVRSADRNNVGVIKSIKGSEAEVHFINKEKGTEATVTIPTEKLAIAKNAGEGTDLSNYNSWLSEYANVLAGKKISIDRPFEKIFGRQILEIGGALKRRSGANMIGGNVSSAVTNFIPLTQAIATTSKPSMAKAIMQGMRQPFSPKPGMIDGMQSTFLKNRFAKTELSLGKGDKVKDAAGWLFEAVDRYTSETIVRGKYNESIAKGMSKEAALTKADDYARKTLADRSVGEMPMIFNSKVLGSLTQFQLEVNNQVSVLMKDIPKNASSRKQVASQLAQVVIYSYIANNLYQQVTGRRPAIDPIEYALNLKANIDKANSKDDTKKKIKGYVAAAGNLAGDVTSGLPFGNIPTLLLGKDGGRMPFTSGFPDPTQVASHPIRELSKPVTTYALPMAGGQIRKSVEGIDAFMKGKVTDAAGKTQFNIDQNPVNGAKVALFGKYADPNGQRYLASKGISPGVAPGMSKQEQATQDIKNLTDAANAKGTNRKAAKPDSNLHGRAATDAHIKAYFPTEKTPTQATKDAANRMASVDKNIGDKVSDNSRQTLLGYAKLDTKGKEAYNNDPSKVFQLHQAQYENKKASGKLNPVEDYKMQQSLGREQITSKYSKEVQDFYSMSKTDQTAYFKADRTKATELYDQAKQLDSELNANKFSSTPKYKYGLGSKPKKATVAKIPGVKKGSLNYASRLSTTSKSSASSYSALRKLVQGSKMSTKTTKPKLKTVAYKKSTVRTKTA